MLNRLEMLRIFCAAAESASFKAAATRLGTSPQTVTRAVKDLEEAVGEPLFHRNTRQIRDRKSTRLNSSHIQKSRMPSSA